VNHGVDNRHHFSEAALEIPSSQNKHDHQNNRGIRFARHRPLSTRSNSQTHRTISCLAKMPSKELRPSLSPAQGVCGLESGFLWCRLPEEKASVNRKPAAPSSDPGKRGRPIDVPGFVNGDL
jgi:hypothetical protein